MADVERFVYVVRLDGAEKYLLWETGEDIADRFVIDDEGHLLAFPTESAARDASIPDGVVMFPDMGPPCDLDAIDTWCRSGAPIGDCPPLLTAWNLFNDLPRAGTLYSTLEARMTTIYDKLFSGCNLPAMTPPGEHYVPTWMPAETESVKRLFLLGLAELRGRLR